MDNHAFAVIQIFYTTKMVKFFSPDTESLNWNKPGWRTVLEQILMEIFH